MDTLVVERFGKNRQRRMKYVLPATNIAQSQLVGAVFKLFPSFARKGKVLEIDYNKVL